MTLKHLLEVFFSSSVLVLQLCEEISQICRLGPRSEGSVTLLFMKSHLNLFSSVFVGLIVLYLKITLILQNTADTPQQRHTEN